MTISTATLLIIILVLGLPNINTAWADEMNGLTCLISYTTWDMSDHLTVNWTAPDIPDNHGELNVTITRLMDGNEISSTCQDRSLTSCTWMYERSLNFNNFTLIVKITTMGTDTILFQKEWDVNPDVCKRPPIVSHLTADVINSTCVDVTTWYNRNSYCFYPFFKVTLTPKHGTDLLFNLPLTMECNASLVVCDLSPFMTYTIAVEARFTLDDQVIGQFSEPQMTTITTYEAVPAAAPATVDGCYSLISTNCTVSGTRAVRIYWKDVEDQFKNGIITSFEMNIIPHPSAAQERGQSSTSLTISGGTFTTEIAILCELAYTIRLVAATSAGVSASSSTLHIPRFNQDSEEAAPGDIVPVIANDLFHVYLADRTSHLSQERKVFWCLKNIEGYCRSPINWTTVLNTSEYTIVPVQHDISSHNYLLGVSNGDRGITWTSCYYTGLTDIPVLSDVRLKSDRALEAGTMVLSWDDTECTSRLPGPYIHHYLISYCPATEKHPSICKEPKSVDIVSNKRSSYIFRGLITGHLYKVCVQAVGLTNITGNYSCLNDKTTKHVSFWNTTTMTVVISIIVISSLCAIYAGVNCRSHLKRQCQKWYKRQFGIRTPEDRCIDMNMKELIPNEEYYNSS